MSASSSGLEQRNRLVTSAQNPRVKRLRALLDAPDKSGSEFAFEGDNLLVESSRAKLKLTTVFLAESRSPGSLSTLNSAGAEIISLPDSLFRSVVATEAPQGVAAIAKRPEFSLRQVLEAKNPLILIAGSIQDPGNLGTLIRSADAFGAAGVLTLPGTVSAWNQKALRASAGSTFRLPVVEITASELEVLKQHGVRLYAALANGDLSANEMSLRGPSAILVGNEGAGLPPDLIAFADSLVTIPCVGPVESLNAAVAGSILLYEASQARSRGAQ